MSTDSAGVLTSAAFFGGAMYVSYLYISETRNEASATTPVALLAFGPYTFYNLSLYTESMFIFLLAVGLYCLHQERWLTAGVVGGLLSATRPTGALFGFALLFGIVQSAHADTADLRQTIVEVVTDGKKVLALGLFLFMLYLHVKVGDALAFTHVQRAWGGFREPGFRITREPHGIKHQIPVSRCLGWYRYCRYGVSRVQSEIR